MLPNATFPTIYLLLTYCLSIFPCLVASPTMNNAGNAEKYNLSSYLLITVCQFPLFGVIAGNVAKCNLSSYLLMTVCP